MEFDPNKPLTANQKKKLRQKKSKIGKRHHANKVDSGSSEMYEGSCSVSAKLQSSQVTSLSAADSSTACFCESQPSIMAAPVAAAPQRSVSILQPSSSINAVSCTESSDSFPRHAGEIAIMPSGPQATGGRVDMTAALLVMQSAAEVQQQQQQQQQQQLQQQQKRSRSISAHGNYKNYYGYRGTTDSDPRLQVMERCWFANKRCLDIGCNAGLVSLAIASQYGTSAMLGLDIDATLVRTASTHLARKRADVAARLAASRQMKDTASVRVESASLRALKGVWFQQGDIAAEYCPLQPGSCDIALALSVTKWIHINGGDDGLRHFFAAVHVALVPGGLLILEPQPWRSYKQALRKRALVAGARTAALDDLKLRPDDFVEFLQASGQFRFVRQLLEPGDVNRGFASRPMYLLERI